MDSWRHSVSSSSARSHNHDEEELYVNQSFNEATADIMNQEYEPVAEGLVIGYLEAMRKQCIAQERLEPCDEVYEAYVDFVKKRIQQSFALLQENLNRHVFIIHHGMVCPEDECHLRVDCEADTEIDGKINRAFKEILKAKQNLVHIEKRHRELERLRDFSKQAAKGVSEASVD